LFFYFSPDTKSIAQTHSAQLRSIKQNVVQRHWSRLNDRVTDTFLTECFTTALEGEPQDYRHILTQYYIVQLLQSSV